MATEIERKFLVIGDDWMGLAAGTPYRQGYLNRDPRRTVRVRVAGLSAFLTVKGMTVGTTRQEFEYSIPKDDAEQLLGLCDGPLMTKQVLFERQILETTEM